MEEWYTYREIIAKLGICKQTLNNWRRKGIIRYRRISSKIFLYQLPETKIIQENESPKSV